MKPFRFFFCLLVVIIVLFAAATVGGSYYMLGYSLSPSPERADTAARFAWLYKNYPETRPWVDSLRRAGALTDTFAVMPTGERHHAYVVRHQSPDSLSGQKTAFCIHGWRDQGIGMFMIDRLYERMGYQVVLPDLHAHGLSEGEAIGMGWHERNDVIHWIKLFKTDTIVVHGISMGAATTMNVSGEAMPEGISSIKFVEDCGYTSVWDEFSDQLKQQFGLPGFPLMNATSRLCHYEYGWSFSEASPLSQVAKCRYPMLFIHGDNDHFVPSWMVHPLYEAKPEPKQLWITAGTQHAHSYKDYPEEYARRVREFVEKCE